MMPNYKKKNIKRKAAVVFKVKTWEGDVQSVQGGASGNLGLSEQECVSKYVARGDINM